MSMTRTSSFRRQGDHFEPENISDAHEQRRMRGLLEQIDYTAFASNREVIGHSVGHADAEKFQHLAVAAANARAHWVEAALKFTAESASLTPAQIDQLAQLRAGFQELTEVYEATRRMVERGYVTYR